jgi:predicted metal-dependent hydrolase
VSGRPRQSRPRDELGRPLPFGATGVPPVPEHPLPPEDTVVEATRLLRQGRPFSAHEVFEARWKACPDDERDLWQGLAQLCVGITHARRGNPVGAARLVGRGSARLERHLGTAGATYGIDVRAWVEQAQAEVDAATPRVR